MKRIWILLLIPSFLIFSCSKEKIGKSNKFHVQEEVNSLREDNISRIIEIPNWLRPGMSFDRVQLGLNRLRINLKTIEENNYHYVHYVYNNVSYILRIDPIHGLDIFGLYTSKQNLNFQDAVTYLKNKHRSFETLNSYVFFPKYNYFGESRDKAGFFHCVIYLDSDSDYYSDYFGRVLIKYQFDYVLYPD